MSLSVCTSCLARLRLASVTIPAVTAATRVPTISSFHTSSAHQDVVKKKKPTTAGSRAPKTRESRSAKINKKKREKPKLPAVGQRKSERLRIVLSNTNALEVRGLKALTAANMYDTDRVGQMLMLDGPLLDQLREAKAFKTTQNWNLFRSPSTLTRKETAELGIDVFRITDSAAYSKWSSDLYEETTKEMRQVDLPARQSDPDSTSPITVQKLVVGEKASGKSVHLLQAMSMAYLNKWVVVNIPDCQEYVNNQSAYAPVQDLQDGQEQKYTHPQLAADLLSRLAHSNSTILSQLPLVHKHPDLLKKQKVKTVKDLAMIGVDDYRSAPQVWDAVWKELTDSTASSKRPPIMIAIDGVNFWMGQSKYMSADFKPIHAHQFTLIEQFLGLLFSKTKNALPNGGMVVGCTTKSNHPSTAAFDFLVTQIAARNSGLDLTNPRFPLTDPYNKHPDMRVSDLLLGTEFTQLTKLDGVSVPEAQGLLEYFAQSGIFREAVTDHEIAEKRSMSGGGIIGELCKLSARSRAGIFKVRTYEGVKIRV